MWFRRYPVGQTDRQTDTQTDALITILRNRSRRRSNNNDTMTMMMMLITNGESNLTKRPHRRRTWTTQSYSPGCAECTPSNTCFPGPTRVHILNGISIGSAVFAELTAEDSYTLQWAALSAQNCPFTWGIWTPSNTWFLGPNAVHNTASRSVQPFLQGALL